MSRCSVSLLGFVLSSLVLGSPAFGQAITVEGITDRTTYVTASRTFRVPTLPGHSYLVLLDGKPVPAGVTNVVTVADYHEISVARTNASNGTVANALVRFIIASPNRNTSGDGPENGLIEFTPYPLVPSTGGEFAGATLNLMMPQEYPPGLEIPVIARVENPDGHVRRANGFAEAGGFPRLKILRGHGSELMPPAAAGSSVEYGPQLTSLSAYKEVNIDPTTAWTTVSGTVAGTTTWPENSRIHVTGHLTVPNGSTLTIGAGTVIKLNPMRNITNSGRIFINGTPDRPVVLTATNRVLPEVNTHAWGGFYMNGSTTVFPQLEANSAIFVGGGGERNFFADPSRDQADSHRSEQPVLFLFTNATARLTNCAFINTAGQVGNGKNSDLTLDRCLVQRAITCGEYVAGTIIVNRSALIEFPEDNGQVNTTIANADYDAIYFTTGTHLIYDSLIGFCKDDAIDSGSGGGGTVLVRDSWIESALHEANAWSNNSGLRQAETYNSVLMNSGQGFECGWSGPPGSPACYASNILSTANSVGARFGDNYPNIGPYNGTLNVSNSFLLYNYRDAWGFTWRQDTGWYYRSNQMNIHDSFLSQTNPYHPDNEIWNGAEHGWRLEPFLTRSGNANVGIGIATWTNRYAMSAIFAGVPVRLSSFATNAVSVQFAFESGTETLQTGTLTFEAGETVKRFFPSGFNLQNYNQVRAVLRNPAAAELTGQTLVLFEGTVPAAQISAFVQSRQLDQARLIEGLPIALSSRAAHPITVNYTFEVSGGAVLSSGTVAFAPGETLAWAPAPVGASGHDLIRVSLTNPSAPLVGPSTIYYVKSSVGTTLPPVSLIPWGSTWRYPNTAGALADAWKTTGFNDTAWQSGPTELGFGDGDEARAITRFSNQITYYFRTTFNVDNPNELTNLSMSLLRDDGAVVYFNGTEVFRSSSLPAFPAVITATTLTADDQDDNVTESATLSRNALVPGANLAAVEMHQQTAGSSDLSFNLELAGNPVPPPTPQRVYMATFDGQLTLAWADATFVLEHATAITGPWTTVANSGPFFVTPDPGTPQRFFRLRR